MAAKKGPTRRFKPKGRSSASISKAKTAADAARQVLAQHPEMKAHTIVSLLGRFGWDITPAYVYTLRSAMKLKLKKPSKAKPEVTRKNGTSVKDLILTNPKLEVSQLMALVHQQTGHRTTSSYIYKIRGRERRAHRVNHRHANQRPVQRPRPNPQFGFDDALVRQPELNDSLLLQRIVQDSAKIGYRRVRDELDRLLGN